ncbi:MAG: hypothetical protein Q8859_13030 [Bacteroidota bacterium]|nr:hypothetical protein [Bacteroidota bacterium]
MKISTFLQFAFLLLYLISQQLLVNGQNKDAEFRKALVGTWIIANNSETLNISYKVEYTSNGDIYGEGFVISKVDNVSHPINFSGKWSINNSQLKEIIKNSNIPGFNKEYNSTILSITTKNLAQQASDGTITVVPRKIDLYSSTKNSNTSAGNSKQTTNHSNTPISISNSDIAMAQQVIDNNTMTLPGFVPGSSIKSGPGPFCPSDALVLYMLKFHQQTKTCPPIAVITESLKQLNDIEFNKKAVSIFWQEYCNYQKVDISNANFLHDYFEIYILKKHTNRLKITNARLQGYVGAEEAWSKAMSSQQKSWQKSVEREDEFILKRDASRVIINTQDAVDAAAKAVSGD